jgi:acyl-CoA thioester hydrolase
MAKPDPHLLDPASYPYSHEVATRYADLDPNNHINNVAMAAMIEDARVRFHIATGFATVMPAGGQMMIVNLVIDYVAQAYYPQPLTIYTGVAAVGGRSLRLRHLLVQSGKPVALAEAVAVYVCNGRAEAVPDTLVASLQEWACR